MPDWIDKTLVAANETILHIGVSYQFLVALNYLMNKLSGNQRFKNKLRQEQVLTPCDVKNKTSVYAMR